MPNYYFRSHKLTQSHDQCETHHCINFDDNVFDTSLMHTNCGNISRNLSFPEQKLHVEQTISACESKTEDISSTMTEILTTKNRRNSDNHLSTKTRKLWPRKLLVKQSTVSSDN